MTIGAGHDDRGVTLVELLVTMVISGVVFPLVIGILIAAQHETTGSVQAADAVDELRLSVAAMRHPVRLGSGSLNFDSPPKTDPVTTPVAAVGIWTADAGGGPGRCTQFKVVGDTLRSRSFAVDAAPSPMWEWATVVGRGLSSASPFAAVAGAPGTVRVRLVATSGSSRHVSIDSSLTTRNTTSAATIACGVF